ncbi:MAG: tRNA epoxyqueuosine(34) reductase QueG [Bacteroidales bacterium]|nr:tRNA epoxyqueuosine(34) reductase QueG [Bacteroidales bacterium]
MESSALRSACIRAQLVKDAAREVGFDACGIAQAAALNDDELHLRPWLAEGCQAEMHYMEEHVEKRYDPRLLLPGAKSVISVLLGYKPSQRMEGKAKVAQYAYGQDYHERVKGMLYRLMAAIREECPNFEAKPCVDTVPINDRAWAVRAGLGWRGRNTLLVNPELGSYCYIGELVTTFAADQYDSPIANGCGDCHRCVDACPNGCLVPVEGDAYWNDARRCASYHTIENRAESLPEDVRLSGYAFGCDCCQLVCPYNIRAEVCYQLSNDDKERLESLAEADEATFKHAAKHAALGRIKYSQWCRNIRSIGRMPE